MKYWLGLSVLIAASTVFSQEYYQADPAKLAQLEAQRCNKISTEQSLIQRRLTGYNQSYDIKKMQDKLKILAENQAKYCKPREVK